MSDYIDIDALWHVALLSTAFGAGTVTLYALGIRSLALAEAGGDAGRRRRAIGIACFVACAAVVAIGIRVMLAK